MNPISQVLSALTEMIKFRCLVPLCHLDCGIKEIVDIASLAIDREKERKLAVFQKLLHTSNTQNKRTVTLDGDDATTLETLLTISLHCIVKAGKNIVVTTENNQHI